MSFTFESLEAAALEIPRCRRLQRRNPTLFQRILREAIEEQRQLAVGVTSIVPDTIDEAAVYSEIRILDRVKNDAQVGGIETILINMVIGFVVKLIIEKLLENL